MKQANEFLDECIKDMSTIAKDRQAIITAGVKAVVLSMFDAGNRYKINEIEMFTILAGVASTIIANICEDDPVSYETNVQLLAKALRHNFNLKMDVLKERVE